MIRQTATAMSSSSSALNAESSKSPSELVVGDISVPIMRTETISFSSGNPRIEETRGVMHLFSNDADSTSFLPVVRKPLLCILGVPNHMTYADFCQFCASFIHHISEMRIVRNEGLEDRYSVLIRFDNQDSTDKFYWHFNGREFNSLEKEVCRMLFTMDVQFTGYSSLDHAQSSPASLTDQPSCPVCLERLDHEASGILTTICNHSFHCSCISKWTDSSCPVCRYCQQQPEKSTCIVCQTSENLWMCILCGFVGCGRYRVDHARLHWRETQHCYSLELETQRVWDYVGDNYVHRLIQSKTDGKLVEFNSHCQHVNDGCGTCYCDDSGISEAILSSKVEAIVNKYNELLANQLENQKLVSACSDALNCKRVAIEHTSYFETLLEELEEETDREVAHAVQRAVSQKLQKSQAKLDRCMKEKKFLDDLNENLLKNQEIWKAKLSEVEERYREKKVVKMKDDQIHALEEKLKILMATIEAENTEEQMPISDDIKDGTALPICAEPSSRSS